MSLQNPINTTRAEQMPIKEVEKIFVPPEPHYSVLLRKKHTVILGPRECGKSMILKYLSLSAQVIKFNPNRIGDLDFIGIYIPFSEIICKPFALHDTGSPPQLFDYYSALNFALAIIEAFSTLPQKYNEEKGIIFEDMRSHFPFKQCTSLEKVREKILEIQTNIQSVVEKTHSLSAEEFDKIISVKEFVPEMCRRLSQKFNKPIYLLIDGYENLGDLARVLNVLIPGTEVSSSYCLKIGARSFGKQISKEVYGNLDIESDRDYDIVSLFYEEPLEIRYLECIEEIIDEHHLAKSEEELFKDKKIKALLSLRDNLQLKLYEHFPNYQNLPRFSAKNKEARQKNYFDFPMFALLSSGIIGTFVRLIHRVFYEYINIFPEEKTEKIEFRNFTRSLQSKAAKEFAKDDFWRILRHGGEQGRELQRLVYHSLSRFNENFEKNAIREALLPSLSIVSSSDDQGDVIEKIKRVLMKGFEVGVFQARSESMVQYEKSQILPENFRINFSLLPKFGLKPVVGEKKEYNFSIFNKWCDSKHHEEIDRGAPVSDYKKIEKKVFLGTPIKKPTWEEKARKILKLRISEALMAEPLSKDKFQRLEDKPCFDAEDIDSENIREGALRGNDMSNYGLFEVTSKNPNVFFELGYAMGLNKPVSLLWNVEEEVLDTDALPRLIRDTNIAITGYYFKGGKLVRWKETFPILRRRIKKEPLKEGCYIFPSEQCKVKFGIKNNYFYLYHQEVSYWNQPHKEIKRFLRLKEPGLPTRLVGKSKMCEYCYEVKSSKIILINTVKEDLTSYFLLGFAYGAEKQDNGGRIIIYLYKKDEEPISMIRDYRLRIPYNVKSLSSDIISKLEEWKEVLKIGI